MDFGRSARGRNVKRDWVFSITPVPLISQSTFNRQPINMAPRKKTVKRKVVKRKRPMKRRKTRGRFSKRGGPRMNAPSTKWYRGSEVITIGAFSTNTLTSEVWRFDAIQLPRFTALAPEFKHFKFTRATIKIVPRTNPQAWYNVSATTTGQGNQGRSIVTFIEKDGNVNNFPSDLAEARLKANARFHTMQKTVMRSFVPMAIKKTELVTDDANNTQKLIQFINPWLDTSDANSYLVDRTAVGMYAPPLVDTSGNALSLGYDVYLEVKYILRGVNHTTDA